MPVPTAAPSTERPGQQNLLRTDGSRAWLTAVGALALAYALYVGRGGAQPIPLVLLSVALVCLLLAVVRPMRPRIRLLGAPTRLIAFGVTLQVALLAVWPLMDPLALGSVGAYWPLWLGLALAVPLSLTAFRSDAGASLPVLLGLVAVHAAIGVWAINAAPIPHIDVYDMQVAGSRALANGINPYLPIYENIHGADTTYYGPGLVVDGELTIGFPYPPLSLLLVVPGEVLLGDPRYIHLAAMSATFLGVAAIQPGRIATAAALLYLFNPWTFFTVVGSWTEPLVVLALTTVVLTAVRAPRLVGLGLGVLIAIKQYVLLALPIALILLTREGPTRWRTALQSLGMAAALTLPFVIWDVEAFTWSTIGSLAGQVFRPDSLSYLAVLPGDLGPRLSFLGFALLVPGLVLVWRRAPRSPAGFAVSLSFLLLVFFAFSRQGSGNYYFTVIGAACCAIAATDWHEGLRLTPKTLGDARA